jgi:hypothetical protein
MQVTGTRAMQHASSQSTWGSTVGLSLVQGYMPLMWTLNVRDAGDDGSGREPACHGDMSQGTGSRPSIQAPSSWGWRLLFARPLLGVIRESSRAGPQSAAWTSH